MFFSCLLFLKLLFSTASVLHQVRQRQHTEVNPCCCQIYTLFLGCCCFFFQVQTERGQNKAPNICEFSSCSPTSFPRLRNICLQKVAKSIHFWFLPLKFSFRCRLSTPHSVPLKSSLSLQLIATPGLKAHRESWLFLPSSCMSICLHLCWVFRPQSLSSSSWSAQPLGLEQGCLNSFISVCLGSATIHLSTTSQPACPKGMTLL